MLVGISIDLLRKELHSGQRIALEACTTSCRVYSENLRDHHIRSNVVTRVKGRHVHLVQHLEPFKRHEMK